MTHDEINDLADRFVNAVATCDVATVEAIYADDATIWHNFDKVNQTRADNIKTLLSLHRSLTNMRYEEVRRTIVDDGYYQQHVLRGTAKNGELDLPAALRVYVSDGRITRLEEYLDTAQVAAVMR
ncbi:MAG: nuclear transport factor 2 family protein [Actinomycetota bacterium]|jgi:ketosteroid isomerase-like protein